MSDLSQEQIHTTVNKIRSLKLHGFAGDCGWAAIQINRKVFDGKGVYVAALNNFWLERDRWVGHVAVHFGDRFWDTSGTIREEDFIEWGMLDPEDPDYDVPGWDEDAAYSADIFEVTEEEIRQKFDICTIQESSTPLQRLIESVVSEVLKELAPEAPEDAPFGQYLFAPHRKDLSPEEKQESNTEAEMRFRDALRNHYEGDPRALGGLAQEIIDMVNKGWYTKILATPNETIYRYISDIDTKLAAQMLNLSPDTLEEAAGWVEKYGPGTMKPGGSFERGSGIHSWSTRLDEEWILADLHPPPLQPGQSALILVAKTGGNNFFINPNTIDNVEKLPSYAYYQDEVVSYGPVQFEEAWVLTNSKHGEYAKDAMEGNDVLFQLIESI